MLLVTVLAVLVGIGVALGAGLGAGVHWVRDLLPDRVPSLTADKVAAPSPAAVGGPSQPCPATSVTLLATPSASSIEVGQGLTFQVSVTNSGRRPCLVDGGDGNRQLQVSNAHGDVVWTSAHCTSGARDLLLGPGDADSRTFQWSGKTSAKGACSTGQPTLEPGTYTVQALLAAVPEAKSAPVSITVTAPPEPSPSPDASAGETPSDHPDAPATETPSDHPDAPASPPANASATDGATDAPLD
ncbi:MAG: hypothetical protein FWF90_09030 [Promicromonosporaceae bacterium]|nr:hypothetical protein [Promicromonosporaceae bacterium]